MHPLNHRSLDIILDITNKCNLRCIMCHFSLEHVFQQQATFLSPDNFEKIIQSLHKYTRKLTLSAAYEPLISPHIIDILKITSRYPCPEINFLTNGTLLNKQIVDAIFAYDVTEVCISMHAATRSTYEYILQGAAYDKTIKNLLYITSKKKQLGRGVPKLHFNVVLLKSNIHEIEEIVVLAARLGISTISFRHLIVFDNLDITKESLALNDEEKKRSNFWINRALEKAAELGVIVLNCPDYFDTGEAKDTRQARTEKHTLMEFLKNTFAANKPFGSTDSPQTEQFADDETIEVSGWALGYNSIDNVELKLLYPDDEAAHHIGHATFHNATRPDVGALYPQYPESYRSGWTFLFNLAVFKPLQDTFFIHAIAQDQKGLKTTIGVKEIHLIRNGQRSASSYVYCSKPFHSLYIDAHGFTYPYPDCHTNISFGSLIDNSLTDIWFCDSFVKLRQDIIAGQMPIFCQRCPLFINREVNAEKYFQPHKDFSTAEKR